MGHTWGSYPRFEAGAWDVPVVLPVAEPQNPAEQSRQSTSGRRFCFPELDAPGRRAAKENYPRAIWPPPPSAVAEKAYIALARSIVRLLPSEQPAILAITSPGQGDGKTGMALGLAPELARRVDGGLLVVDADFQKPDLSSRVCFSPGAAVGLIYPTDVPGLSVLPAFPEPRARGRAERKLDAAWFNEMRDRWPLVLLDMAALEDRETLAAVRHCDAACLVVRLGHTGRRAAAVAARSIRAAGGRLLGCAVVE